MNSPAPPTPVAATAPAKPRKPRYPATVKRVQTLTPRMVRVTFTSSELADFGWNGPAAHIKLIFGGAPPTQAPAAANTSAATSAPAEPRPTMRTYTPRRFDRDARELDVDFVLHGEGPASAWASRAAVGQTLTVAGPGRNYAIDPSADWFMLAGDDSALPAISTILEHLPATARAIVFVEVVDAAEEHQFYSGANAQITWLHRGENPASAGTLLESAVRNFTLPAGSGRVYVACEAGAVRRIRRHLLAERGMSRDHIVTRGYWKLGETDHPDGDYAQDV
jgi:NADPH-dependent ferric siderophore reductase